MHVCMGKMRLTYYAPRSYNTLGTRLIPRFFICIYKFSQNRTKYFKSKNSIMACCFNTLHFGSSNLVLTLIENSLQYLFHVYIVVLYMLGTSGRLVKKTHNALIEFIHILLHKLHFKFGTRVTWLSRGTVKKIIDDLNGSNKTWLTHKL